MTTIRDLIDAKAYMAARALRDAILHGTPKESVLADDAYPADDEEGETP